MKRHFGKIALAAAAFALCGLLPTANAQITALGPVTGPVAPGDIGGYPQWIQDNTGRQLERVFDPALPDESFYWSAAANIDNGFVPGGAAMLEFAWEAAYAGAGDPVNGQQILFGRMRIRVDVAIADDYTVTHPYGTVTFAGVDPADGINFTEDIGSIGRPPTAFNGIMASPVAPALVWDTFPGDPLLADPVTGLPAFVGDGATPHLVTGSPTGTNSFTVTGPSTITTDLFVVSGKLFTGAAPTPHVFPPPPPQSLAAVGPVNRAAPFFPTSTAPVLGGFAVAPAVYPLGFPIWYQDKAVSALNPSPLHLTIVSPADPLGIPNDPVLDPVDPIIGMPSEGFYWSAEATVAANGMDALLVMAVEAAFGGAGAPAEGQQMVFTRIRIRIDTTVAGTYTVTHPFGTLTFLDVPTGTRAINYTEDLGDINPIDPDSSFRGALFGNISKFLVKPDYLTDLNLTNAFGKHVGDPNNPHIVTGSPTNKNIFKIVGPAGVTAETNLFAVAGLIIDVVNTVNDKAVTVQGMPVVIHVLANDTNIDPTATQTLAIPANALPANGTAVVNADGLTILYTPNPGFYGNDSFGYIVSEGGVPPRVSAQATVSVNIKRILEKVTAASVAPTSLAPKVRWTASGKANPALRGDPANTVNVYAGPTVLAPLIGTAKVNAAGNWTLTKTLPVTTPLNQLTAVSVTTSDGGVAENQTIIKTKTSTISTAGALALTQGPMWNLSGTGAPGSTLTIELLRPDLLTSQALATVLVKPTGAWTFRGRVLDTLPLVSATTRRTTSNAVGAVAVDESLVTVATATAMARGAAATRLGSMFTVTGKGVPGTTVTVFLGSDLLGAQIGTAVVKTNGTWRLSQRVMVDLPLTAVNITVLSSAGGTPVLFPLRSL